DRLLQRAVVAQHAGPLHRSALGKPFADVPPQYQSARYLRCAAAARVRRRDNLLHGPEHCIHQHWLAGPARGLSEGRSWLAADRLVRCGPRASPWSNVARERAGRQTLAPGFLPDLSALWLSLHGRCPAPVRAADRALHSDGARRGTDTRGLLRLSSPRALRSRLSDFGSVGAQLRRL